MPKPRKHADDLRGASRLIIDATKGVTRVVEAMHRTIAQGPDLLGRPLDGPAKVALGPVYGSIRGVTELVGASIDLVLTQLAPLLGETELGAERLALLAALNGVMGDYLLESGNPLALGMQLCSDGTPLVPAPVGSLDPARVERSALAKAFPRVTGKVLVMIHGCCMSDLQWRRGLGHDLGIELANDLGYTPIYVRYNTGLHISTNGRNLDQRLEALMEAWPVPVESLTLVGHSMGGLVARSACHVIDQAHAVKGAKTVGNEAGRLWREKLRALVCLGSPHHGAPLERGGSFLELLLQISKYSAPLARLGRVRSAGVTDMRFGIISDEHWDGRDRFAPGFDPRAELALPAGVECFAVAGSLSKLDAPHDRLRGDGLVPVESALGQHPRPELTLAFPEGHTWVALGVHHLDLLKDLAVLDRVTRWLTTT